MRKFLLATALALIAVPAFAATTNWTIDPAASKLTWTVPFNKQPVSGQFDKWTGIIVFDPDNLPASSLTIIVDLASVDSKDPNRDGTIKGPDFFNVAATPTATFTSTKITKTSQGYVAGGNLSLGGVSKPLAVPFSLTINGTKALGNGTITISRNAFGIGKGQWQSASEVGDLVNVSFTVAANAAAAPAVAVNPTAKDVNDR